MNDWTYAGDYDEQTLERVTPHGVFRARLMLDRYPDAPDSDGGCCPVYGYDTRGYFDLDDAPRYGADSDAHSGIDFHAAVSHFYDRAGRFSDAVEMTGRWLRAFHGGSVREISSSVYQGGPWYLTFDTRAMREYWGMAGANLAVSAPEAPEWQAYIDSDVWGITVERATSFDDDGEPNDWTELEDGSVWGFYGETWARESATEMLESAIDSAAAGMLPAAQ